jgi:hypothetical protein
MFWVDLVGFFPFEAVGLAIAGEVGEDTNKVLFFDYYDWSGCIT